MLQVLVCEHTMGETLGIAHNVFEKVAREKDRKERLKKFDEWQRTKAKKQQRLVGLKARLGPNGSFASMADPEDLDDPIFEDCDDEFNDYSHSPYKSTKSLSKMPPMTPKTPRLTARSKAVSLRNFQSNSSSASLGSLDDPSSTEAPTTTRKFSGPGASHGKKLNRK